jgi:hypothetical protein
VIDFYFRNKSLTDVWNQAANFLADYKAAGIPATISDENATTLYYLLYARYGNSTIASSDENQFKYKVFSIIFQYGATWEKRLEIQETLRGLTEDDLLTGSRQIMNAANNPANEPTTATLEELTYIDRQSTVAYKKSKMDAYGILMDLLETDITGSFLTKFKQLFLTVVAPEKPGWYISEDDEEA